MFKFLGSLLAAFATGMSIAEVKATTAKIKEETGHDKVVYHFDGTVSGLTGGELTELGRAIDFA